MALARLRILAKFLEKVLWLGQYHLVWSGLRDGRRKVHADFLGLLRRR